MGSLLDTIKTGFTSLLGGGEATAEAPKPAYEGQIMPPASGVSPQENVNVKKLDWYDEYKKSGLNPSIMAVKNPDDPYNSEKAINLFEGDPRLTPNQPTNLSTLLPKAQAGDSATTGESVASDAAVDSDVVEDGKDGKRKVRSKPVQVDIKPDAKNTTTGGATTTATTGGAVTTGTKGAVVPVTTTGGATGGATGGGGAVTTGGVNTVGAGGAVTTGGAPAVPVAPTGNTYSFEGDKEAKGTSGDVKSQAMYDLAQEALSRGDMRGAEAILRRPLTNQDYFPGPGLQQARTAWGDPLFTGAGQLFPMAVMDARQKAMAEAEAMAMREEALNFEIPKIEVAGLRSNYSQTFVSDAEKFVADGIAKYGSRRNAIRELKRSGEWAKFMADHKATADAINYTGKEAQTFLKNAQDGQLKGETYASPEALAAAQAYLLGLKEWGSKQINNTQLNELAEQFKVWESWDKYEKNSRDRIKPTDISAADLIAQQAAQKATQEDIVAFNAEAVRLGLPGGEEGMKAWLYNKKISEVLAPQIKAAVIEPFFASNPSAVRQFQARYPNMEIEAIKNLVAEQYAMGYGRQVVVDNITQTPKASNTTYISLPGDKPGEIYYQDVFTRTGEIVGNTQGIVETLNKQNATGQQRIDLAKKSFREMFRKISNKGEVTNNYMGYEPIKVQTYDIKSAPVPYNEYKKYNPKTRMYEPMTPADFGFTGKDAQERFENSRPEGNPVLNKLELVMLQPDGSTIPWDGKNVPAGTELYVAMTHLVDIEKPGITADGEKAASKTKTALTISPLSQMGKRLDDLFQRLSKNELESKSQGGAFKFGE